MGITRFPHGISAWGVPVSPGAGRFAGWWGNSYFVDYDSGADGNDGDTPDNALKHLQDAIDLATINDVIYIRNREQAITSTDPEYNLPESTTNWSVAEAKTHLSIIGASNVSHLAGIMGSANMAVILRGNATETTGPVLDWRGAFGLIENLAFHRGAVTSGSLLSLTGNSTSLRAANSVVSNCLFRMDSNSGGSIYNVDNWWVTIYKCTFHDCRIGVYLHGSNSTIRRNTIDSCSFRNQTATSCDTNLLVSGSGSADNFILNCDFGPVPNYSGGTNKFINVTAAATGLIAGCRFGGDTNTFTQYLTYNGMKVTQCHDTGEATIIIKDS